MHASVLGFIFLLFLSPSPAADTVAEDIGPHQLERLVELLTAHECEELISALSHTEQSIFQRLDRLSIEKNQLLLDSRRRRSADEEPPCRLALKDWLQTHGKQIYYDRLSRALQQIGRTDIAIEVGKNINQDKTLAMQRYVEGYHELVSKMAAHLEEHQLDDHQVYEDHEDHEDYEDHEGYEDHEEVPKYTAKQARGITWKDVDLVVKRQPVPPYQHQPLDRVWPLIYGLLLGFTGALIMSMSILLISIYASHGNSTKSTPGHQYHHAVLRSIVTSSERASLRQIRCAEDTHDDHERLQDDCSGQ